LQSLSIEKMSYKDFLTFLTPSKKLKSRKRILTASKADQKSENLEKLRFAISQVFNQEMKLYRELDYLRQMSR